MACGLALEGGISKCPLCRSPFTVGGSSKRTTQLMVLAERGVSWAQTNVGTGMIQGTIGFKQQEKAGLKWVKKAAAQNHPTPALYYLSSLYRNGFAYVLKKSQEEGQRAADEVSKPWIFFCELPIGELLLCQA